MTTKKYYIKYLRDDYFYEQAELRQENNLYYLQDKNWKHFEWEEIVREYERSLVS
jgi:hypothetical protein